MQDVRYLTVTALTKYLKSILENNDHLKQIYIKGEISNLTKHSRGHFYFTLKDESAQIRVTMFSNYASKLTFSPKDGDKIRLFGSISLYEAGGSYNINAYQLEPDGVGSLYLAYEKLKKELESLGYFKPENKKPIPSYPKAIGVVTSPTGAAIRDIIHTIERRYPLARVYLYPALVQGEGAKKSISDQIIKANKDKLVDTLIVGRGGGSIEDLWGFNEIEVVMAIYQSKIPVISAVGHETDFTLSDFVSDLRAPTPTAAAELATPSKQELLELVKAYQNRLFKAFDGYYKEKSMMLMHLDERLMQASPAEKIKKLKSAYEQYRYLLDRNYQLVIREKKTNLKYLNQQVIAYDFNHLIALKKEKLDLNSQRLLDLTKRLLERKQEQFDRNLDKLKLLNPLSLMDKGYTYTSKDNHRIESVSDINMNDQIQTRLKDGIITSVVTNKEALTWKK